MCNLHQHAQMECFFWISVLQQQHIYVISANNNEENYLTAAFLIPSTILVVSFPLHNCINTAQPPSLIYSIVLAISAVLFTVVVSQFVSNFACIIINAAGFYSVHFSFRVNMQHLIECLSEYTSVTSHITCVFWSMHTK